MAVELEKHSGNDDGENEDETIEQEAVDRVEKSECQNRETIKY